MSWLDAQITSWEEFWKAPNKHGLTHFGDRKKQDLETKGAYFAKRNLNMLDGDEIEEAFGSAPRLIPKLSAGLEDPGSPEGFGSVQEVVELADKARPMLYKHDLIDNIVAVPC